MSLVLDKIIANRSRISIRDIIIRGNTIVAAPDGTLVGFNSERIAEAEPTIWRRLQRALDAPPEAIASGTAGDER